LAKRVAVVGAGPSGLVTIKELLEEGHEPTCFERATGLGGVFRYGERDGVIWESCRLTSSPLLTSFSDFPDPAGRVMHLPVGEYVDYLGRYCEAFNLRPHIRFETNVEVVTRNSAGDWTVRTRDASGPREARFDAVAICSGLHQHPHLPRFPGQESYTGAVLHGAHYRRPSQVAGQRVLVVGAGESGADVAAEVAANAAETMLSLRRGVAVQSRVQLGKPKDLQTSRLMNSTAHWVFQTRNPADDHKRRVYRWTFLPFLFVDKGLQQLSLFVFDFLPVLWAPDLAGLRANLRTRRLSLQLLRESGGTFNEQFGTKDDDFVRAIATRRCRRAPGIARFDGPRVVFDDGSSFTPDLLIFCTGFDTRMPFLDEAVAAAPRFLHTFHPEIGPSLGFIGFLRPAFGAIPPLAELQARWFALVQSGRAVLPSPAAMQQSIDYWTHFRAHFFRAVKGRLDHLVEHTSFCDALAEQIGCKPTWRDIRRESRRFQRKFMVGPFVAAQYRLVGPHAKPEIARAVVENVPIHASASRPSQPLSALEAVPHPLSPPGSRVRAQARAGPAVMGRWSASRS
jgi:dimethylaniline monooxygenase (N-oxide forming)